MTVYVVQESVRKDRRTGKFVPIDISQAAAYGNIEVMLPNNPIGIAMQPVVNRLRHALRNFSDDDYLLAMGDPVAIGIAFALASQANRGKVKTLRWDRRVNGGSYIEVHADLKGTKV
jgi:hypothetical protein